MRLILQYWFRFQASKAAHKILTSQYNYFEREDILKSYWKNYKNDKQNLIKQPTLGGSLMVHLAAMSHHFYDELIKRGLKKKEATTLFYKIAWEIYKKMWKFAYRISTFGKKNNFSQLEKATKLFRNFPFNSPSYKWEDVKTINNTVAFNCLKCPVAEYFIKNDLSNFCAETWCALDFPLAKTWGATLERKGSIADGSTACDFKWKSIKD